jgi:hypothetical protein
VTITVTQEHIDKGCPGGLNGPCPIHLALMERGVESRGVGFFNVTLSDDRLVSMPEPARAFVMDFDHSMPVAPFTFELEIPQ